MAGDRTLKLSLLADTKGLTDGLKKGEEATESFGKQLGDISAKVVKSFALIGAAVGGLSIAFAKAAAEDELAANKLAQTIGSVTQATEQQIAAVGDYITKTSIATGITDDELRPAFERLVRSTKNVDDATKLLNLSLDLSAATGRPLEQVAAALGRAYDGNTSALGRLGLGIDQSLIKSKDFNAIYETLNKTFGEFSENRSEEAIVKFQRLQVALSESKEAIGAALLPAFEALGDWLLEEGVPRLEGFIAGLVGDNSLSAGFTKSQKNAEEFGKKVRKVIDTFIEYKDILIAVTALVVGVFVVSKIAAGVQATILLIQGLVAAYTALRNSATAAAIASRFALNPLAGLATGAAVVAAIMGAIKMFDDQKDSAELSYNQQRELQIANAAKAAGGGGTGAAGGGGFSTGGGGGLTTGGGGTSTGSGVKVATPPTLIEVVSEANAAKYFGNTGITLGAGDVNLRDRAADTGVFQPIPSGFNPAMVRAGDERGNIVINVNAPSVIDKEGFSRAVSDALNESNARLGAGGAGLRGIQAL